METPRTRSSTRHRRAPTPKLSERKKNLFPDVRIPENSPIIKSPYVRLERLIIEEDSDLGPMSPLEFSSSPSSFNDVHRIIAREQKGTSKSRRTDFSNIMNEISNESVSTIKTRSKRLIEKLQSNSEEPEMVKDSSSEEELCTSMKKLNSMTGQNYEQQLKTPSETDISNKANAEQVSRCTSFRKSLVFDTGLTPHDNESTTPSSVKSNENESGERPKAKTSLTFNEPTISVRSFYGKPVEKPLVDQPKTDIDIATQINNHKLAAAIAKQKIKKPKSRSKPKILAKQMKAPSLWRFSGKMKFNRFARQRTASKKKVNTSKSSNGTGTTGTDGDKKKFGENNIENVPPTGSEFTSRIEQNLRLQKILKDQANTLSASRDINWNGSPKTSDMTSNRISFLNSDGEDDDDDDDGVENATINSDALNVGTYEEVEVEVEEPSKRKFFKSSANSSAKKYRIMGRLSATLKRGGDLKFELPKRKKKKANKGEETVVLHNEITSIIDRLCSPSKDRSYRDNHSDAEEDPVPSTANESYATKLIDSNEMMSSNINIEQSCFNENIPMENIDTVVYTVDVEKYRQMIPYNTTDPEKISQQESILELLITNNICDDETFKVFIAEPDLHKEKASQILDSLYCVNTMVVGEYENDAAIEWMDSVEPTTIIPDPIILTNLTDVTNETNQIVTTTDVPNNTLSTSDSVAVPDETPSNSNGGGADANETSSDKLFPIFNKNFNAKDTKSPVFSPLVKSTKEWRPIGNQQYQLDVGQKEFGLRTCPQCEMQYSVHEPEDELMHLKYHNCVNILTFNGWNNERVVTQIPDWDLNGRIIYVCEADSKAKKDRAKEVLEMVDRDLGFAARTELKPKTLIYFAIAKQQIVGVCVVQPLEHAHRLKTENGIDCYTAETYPVKCGISRIWVAPQYRRHGIAAKLVTSIRGHFVFGAFLSFDEIAFSSPTEDGKRFAAKLAQRTDFLIYEN